jgi:transketolase
MGAKPKLMRDVLIQEIFARAQRDRKILFMSADLGAESLDSFRETLPSQFIHPGICEQNMIDVAAGLAASGKTVFTYAMASFITARCYEQLKVALGAMKQPVTVVSVGVGLGYDDAGPTHYTTEDMACLRALPGVEIWTPCDEESTREITQECCERPAFRYIRLERPALPEVYHFVKWLQVTTS